MCFPKATSIDEVLETSKGSTSTGDNSFALFIYSKASVDFPNKKYVQAISEYIQLSSLPSSIAFL